MTTYYAGIGHRSVSYEVFCELSEVADLLNTLEFSLRSGGAMGADTAFYEGAGNPLSEIYRPEMLASDPFLVQQCDSILLGKSALQERPLSDASVPMTAKRYKNNIASGNIDLHRRNVLIMTGTRLLREGSADANRLKTITRFVVCYMADDRTGTGIAVRIARSLNIPVLNLCGEPRGSYCDKTSRFILDNIDAITGDRPPCHKNVHLIL